MTKPKTRRRFHIPDPVRLAETSSCQRVRKRYGMTQVQWARMLNADPRSVSRWERGASSDEHIRPMLLAFERAADNPAAVRRITDTAILGGGLGNLMMSLLMDAK